jgi:glycerol dehydrogenase
MIRMLCSTGRYVQGAGAVKEIGRHAAALGKSALLIGGKTALSLCAGDITANLGTAGVACHQECFQGVSSRPEVTRLVEIAKRQGADLVIAVGGGAAIDAGKAVSHELRAPVIVVPTIVATDAPCSALSVIYAEDGSFESYLQLFRNPDCILVDTNLVVQSPAKFLVAGMGDALATYWESGTCARSGRENPLTGGGRPTLAVGAIARLCRETLLEYGLQAKLAVEKKVVTAAFESIVEANILLSGMSSENGGHAAAHSIHNGLTMLEATKSKLHGEKVAFGVLAQLVLEGRSSKDIREILDFCSSVGLPVCLADIGLAEVSREEIRLAAETACDAGETIHATWFPVTPEMVEAAIWGADALGTAHRAELRQG